MTILSFTISPFSIISDTPVTINLTTTRSGTIKVYSSSSNSPTFSNNTNTILCDVQTGNNDINEIISGIPGIFNIYAEFTDDTSSRKIHPLNIKKNEQN